MAKHSGLKEMSSTAISPFEEIPLDASNCKTYLQIVNVETINQSQVLCASTYRYIFQLPISYVR